MISHATPALVAVLILATSLWGSPVAQARTIDTYDAGAPTTPLAPAGPPLISNATASSPSVAAGADASASAPTGVGDPLVKNGLQSPLCRQATAALVARSRRNCETSEFEAAAAPSANYAFDVHIDGGLLGVNSAALLQDYLIAPMWMGLVWIVHTLVVAFEWSFTIDLLDVALLKGVASGLRETQATLTRPWLAVVLTIAAMLAVYHGIVRRRVATTVGQSTAMVAMIALGLWVIMDPVGTVGVLGRWSDQASLGTLGAVVAGSPDHAPQTLADSMGAVFSSAVGEPWCYLEFGDVRWCSDPRRLDPHLRAGALRLAGEQKGQSARLLREARTNGELFLALPANQAARNSINDPSSLLRVLCASTNATACHGPTATLAEFRTQSGTYARLEGLLLIAIGALGMILLLGYLALHLLGSGATSLFYLLLAPAAVLAPALGEGGRACFRLWATRLLGSLVSKLIYSVLLGVVLLMTRVVLGVPALGWWARWLLLSVLWWGTFHNRAQVFGFATRRADTDRGHRPSLGRGLNEALILPRELARAMAWAKGKRSRSPPDIALDG